MTREDIIRMAREAKIAEFFFTNPHKGVVQQMERFAALVASAEREACAKVAETAEPYKAGDLIRARGEQ